MNEKGNWEINEDNKRMIEEALDLYFDSMYESDSDKVAGLSARNFLMHRLILIKVAGK